MSRRVGRRSGRVALFRTYADPFVALSADRAWRADDAIDNGSVTTGLASYIGPALTLAQNGTGQAIKSVSANFAGRYSVAFNAQAATGAYSAVALAGAPTSFSIASVYRIGVSNPNSGVCALTVGGTVNTGVSQFQTSNQQVSRKAAAIDANTTVVTPGQFVMVSVFDASGVTSYVSKRTPVTAAGAGALAGTTFQVGSISSANLFTHNGEWATTGYWTRALTSAEAIFALTMLGRRYRIAIGP